jgi:hypothetical protein
MTAVRVWFIGGASLLLMLSISAQMPSIPPKVPPPQPAVEDYGTPGNRVPPQIRTLQRRAGGSRDIALLWGPSDATESIDGYIVHAGATCEALPDTLDVGHVTQAAFSVPDSDSRCYRVQAYRFGAMIFDNEDVWRTVTFPPVTTTKIRVEVFGATDGWSRITEIEARETANGPNLTVGAIAVASSVYQDDAGYGPQGVINGDRKGAEWSRGGGWNDASENSWPDWLDITFPTPRVISQIDLFSLQDEYEQPQVPTREMTFTRFGIESFSIRWWDGANWQLVLPSTGSRETSPLSDPATLAAETPTTTTSSVTTTTTTTTTTTSVAPTTTTTTSAMPQPDEPTAVRSLVANGFLSGGKRQVALVWSGFSPVRVVIFRNGVRIASSANDGTYVDANAVPQVAAYRVCAEFPLTLCTVTRLVSFP